MSLSKRFALGSRMPKRRAWRRKTTMPNNSSSDFPNKGEWFAADEFARFLLYNVLLTDVPGYITQNIEGGTIPFSYIYWRLSVLKLPKPASREIYKRWEGMGLVEIVRWRGIKIRSDINDK